jgi:GNAT superfamily N-acetyltransferase
LSKEPELKICQAVPNDAIALSAIAVAGKAHWPYSQAQLKSWRSDLMVSANQISRCPTFVAKVDDLVAAFLVLEPGPTNWTLEHLWVLPDYMGRGIGRALLFHARDVAAAGGAEALTIDADPYAEPFYLACGAVRVGTIAAPIDGAPDRVRPQIYLSIVAR